MSEFGELYATAGLRQVGTKVGPQIAEVCAPLQSWSDNPKLRPIAPVPKSLGEIWSHVQEIALAPPEGPWSAVCKAIHDCHAAVHALGTPRVATDIRIGTRVDKKIAPGTGNDGKVQRVVDILAADKK
ncbi:hypothetical protein FRC12_001210 [Ceratobasidium sp. 428]|nr:hypothetical protein FRC12_001210 [Ceratobasidium sp. 428]